MTGLGLVVSVALLLACGARGCQEATAQAQVYSSRQPVVAAAPFIAVVRVSCAGAGKLEGPLYARVALRTLPAVRLPNDLYQVSWIEELSEAVSGDREIHLYNEAGYTALRKALRSEQDVSTVPSLATVILPHSTGYTGPWINSEIMAAIISVVIAYIALSNKSRLLS